MITPSPIAATLLQLSALGDADIFLTCDPKMSFFKQSYARVSNFALTAQSVPFTGGRVPSGQTWYGTVAQVRDIKNDGDCGDLLGGVFLEFTLSGLPRATDYADVSGNSALMRTWVPAIGYSIVDDTDVKIGTQEYDRLSGEYMIMHDEISRPAGKRAAPLIGDYGEILSSISLSGVGNESVSVERQVDAINFSTRTQKVLAPIPYFWTRHAGNYLNLVGSMYQNIALSFRFRGSGDLRVFSRFYYDGKYVIQDDSIAPNARPLQSDQGVISGVMLSVAYIYLDATERAARATGKQTIRFVRVQQTEYDTYDKQLGMKIEFPNNFNNPVTRFVWAWRQKNATSRFLFGTRRDCRLALIGDSTWAQDELMPFISAVEIETNGASRVNQASEYFLYAQPYARAAHVPDRRLVYSHAFALEPDNDARHSGSINLSRIDNLAVRFTFKQRGNNGQAYPYDNANPARFLACNDGVGDSDGVISTFEGLNTQLKSKDGQIIFCAETVGFYTQVGGVFGLLFAA